MSVEIKGGSATLAEFVVGATPSAAARQRAIAAICDTAGVMLAGTAEPAARMVQALIRQDGGGRCSIVGTSQTSSATGAAFANGVAAHALDYDDMCFVSLAHPSCALVPAIVAAAELTSKPGALLPDAYAIGFEIECRLGRAMNPRHYHERGWHCTSTIGTLGAAAAAARVLGLDAGTTRQAMGIAASAACGFKENMGSMVKPLHAGLAARNGVMAAQLAASGFTSSPDALDGPQGYLAVMDSECRSLDAAIADLGRRWEIVDSGITVKLYPSCAATHPPLDALLALRHEAPFTHGDVESIEVQVDSMTPRLLLYDQPTTGLEGKFSMPFCAAAAVVFGRIGIDTFDGTALQDADVRAMMQRVTMRTNLAFDEAAPLSRAHVTVTLRNGRVVTRTADGARGYPGRLTNDELAAKFTGCARRTLTPEAVAAAWTGLQQIDRFDDVRDLSALLTTP